MKEDDDNENTWRCHIHKEELCLPITLQNELGKASSDRRGRNHPIPKQEYHTLLDTATFQVVCTIRYRRCALDEPTAFQTAKEAHHRCCKVQERFLAACVVTPYTASQEKSLRFVIR